MEIRNILATAVTATTLLSTGLTAPTPKTIAPEPEAQPKTLEIFPDAENPVDLNAPKISAKAGFILESNSGKVLYAHHADDRLPIASMTKIATLGVIYDALAKGELRMEDPVLISENASSMGGSQAFLDAGSEYPVRDLIQSIVVASANDSCVALAEQIAGTVPDFVNRMNQFAKSCGAHNTNFVNCTGLPTPGAYSCARDLAKMYQKIMQSPHYGDFNHVWMYDLTHPSGRVTGLTNTNKLIRQYPGCLGGKTGFTNEAGHCITVAAEHGDLKPIAVIIGAPDSKTRFREARELLDYAGNSFTNALLVDHTKPIRHVALSGAVAESVDLYPAESYYQLTKKGETPNLTIASDIPSAVRAPLDPETSVGTIYVMENGKVLKEIAVIPSDPVAPATYWQTVQKVIKHQDL